VLSTSRGEIRRLHPDGRIGDSWLDSPKYKSRMHRVGRLGPEADCVTGADTAFEFGQCGKETVHAGLDWGGVGIRGVRLRTWKRASAA
jgi:hypothetical protein